MLLSFAYLHIFSILDSPFPNYGVLKKFMAVCLKKNKCADTEFHLISGPSDSASALAQRNGKRYTPNFLSTIQCPCDGIFRPRTGCLY